MSKIGYMKGIMMKWLKNNLKKYRIIYESSVDFGLRKLWNFYKYFAIWLEYELLAMTNFIIKWPFFNSPSIFVKDMFVKHAKVYLPFGSIIECAVKCTIVYHSVIVDRRIEYPIYNSPMILYRAWDGITSKFEISIQ